MHTKKNLTQFLKMGLISFFNIKEREENTKKLFLDFIYKNKQKPLDRK